MILNAKNKFSKLSKISSLVITHFLTDQLLHYLYNICLFFTTGNLLELFE